MTVIQVCLNQTFQLSLSFPGPYSFLGGTPSGIELNTSTGEITPTQVGTFVFRISNGEESTEFAIQVINCTPALLQSEFIFCSSSGVVTQQLYLSNGQKYNSWEIVSSPLTGVTINNSGLLTIPLGTLQGGVVVVKVNGVNYNVSIFVGVCPTPQTQIMTQCLVDPLCIVWINQQGGRQSFWFNQIKEYKISQQGSKDYININNEKRYASRGRIEERVLIKQEHLSNEQLASLISLQNSIQAWATTSILNASTYRSIIIDQNSFTTKRTNDSFYSITFEFAYSKEISVQRQ